MQNKTTQGAFTPVIGEKTRELISRFKNKLDPDEINQLLSETTHILSNCVNPNTHEEQDTTHLTVGYVQSGKTMSFTTLSALAADNGYRIIIYFAGTKDNLLTQTTKRLRKDLLNNGKNNLIYKIYENPDVNNISDIRGHLRMKTRPTILITVLKHFGRINNLTELLGSTAIQQELGRQSVLIIDDEADQASLNGFTYANSKKADKSPDWNEETDSKESSTYANIILLRSVLPSHSYVQYTATPQAPLLISISDLLSPKTHTVLTPGKKYTGGKLFFKEMPQLVLSIPDDEVFHLKDNCLTTPPKSLIHATQLYILAVALNVYHWKKEAFLSMMVHAGRDKEASRIFYAWIEELKEKWSNILNCPDGDIGKVSLEHDFARIYKNEAIKFYDPAYIPAFVEIKEYISDIINDTKIALIISDSDAKKDVEWDTSTSHILVGADMLNRGFTVENLAVTYMPRYTKGKSTADTIQQRCRFFGYKLNYLNSCRVFLPDSSIIEYAEYVDHEEEMRKWLLGLDTLENVERQLILSEKLNPTRKNVLPVHIVQSKMVGWHAMNTFQNIKHNTELVTQLLEKSNLELWEPQYGTDDRNHKYMKIAISDVIDFLSAYKFGNYPDTARKSATIRYLQYLASRDNNPLTYVYFIQMAFASEYRKRQVNSKTLKLDQLFSGRDNKGDSVYPGDRMIKKEDSICIQLHKVKLDCKEINKWVGKIAYTLAIYYPEDFAVSYVASEADKQKVVAIDHEEEE